LNLFAAISGSTMTLNIKDGTGGFESALQFNNTANRSYAFPNANGTIALTSDISYPVTSVFGRTGAVVATEGDYTLTQLSDVTITTPSSGQVLKYNGTAWVNDTDANTGTVTSVGLSSATSGVTIGSSPVTTSGTITIAIATATTSQNGLLSSTDWTTFNSKESVLTFSSPLVRTTNTISIPAATTSVNGYLTSTDWNTFNNKGSGSVTSVTGTAPVVSSGGTTPAISMAAATTSVNGYLTSTDWNTFNGKFTLPSLTSGSVLFSNGSTIAQDNANFFWDDVNNRLGIGTSAPTEILHILGASAIVYIDGNSGGTSPGNQTSATLRLRTGGFNVGNFRYNIATDNIEISNVSAGALASGAVKIYGTGGNTTGITVAAAGNVGIGIDTPSAKLDLGSNFSGAGTINKISLYNTATTPTYGFGVSSGQLDYISINDHVFYTGGTPTARLRITTAGDATFSSTLVSTGSGSNTILAGNGLKVTSSNAGLYLNFSPSFTGGVEAEIASSENGLRIVAAGSGVNTMRFLTSNSSGVATERLKIDGTGAATFSSTVTAAGYLISGYNPLILNSIVSVQDQQIYYQNNGTTKFQLFLNTATNSFGIYNNAVGSSSFTITSGGNVLIGTTTSLANYAMDIDGVQGGIIGKCDNSGDAQFLSASTTIGFHFYALNVGAVFYVLTNGDVRNANNSYGAISDIKIKENIVDATPKLNDLLKVKIRNYNLIADESKTKQIGVIAQELEEVFPNMISEDKQMGTDETIKTVKYSVFVPMLIKAIQEQQAQIQELEARIKQLENKII
jgi:hypothetical protein